ncbi:hypothetical protein SAMN04487926_111238 [Paraburkholderia steynii]|uniref:Transmembrane protein n=1 Tax=Paraburkholderia steynii TaxID=1245441 RepID=A0A7Z7FHX8_9BURK|nr:hypothetical protein [Paraburkholderia steynii]SDI07151.1 hypothetical protein SAMN04487926_111238 [Paraburkholderia steynii]
MKTTRFSGSHFLFALGVFTFATTLYAVWRHYSPLPFGDQWDGTIGFYMRAVQHPWQAFFEQHNEHRLVISRLVFFPDVRYFGGRNVISLTANLVFAALLALTFFHIVTRSATLDRNSKLGLAGVILVFTFSWIQQENFTWGFQSQWFAVYLFALLAFHLLDLAAQARTIEGHAKSRVWLTLALVSGIAAAFSMSSGVLVLPVVLVQAIYRRFRPRALLLIVVVTLLVWVGYFFDWQKPASSGGLLAGLREHPFDALRYVLLYLGAPARSARLGLPGAYVAGALVILTLAVYCIKVMQYRTQNMRAVSLLAFALFVSGNALITACGRLWFGVETALSSRYTTASTGAWLALVIFTALNRKSIKQRQLALAVIIFATLLVASAQRFAFRSDRDIAYARLVAGLSLRAHVYDPEITGAVYPFPERLVEIAKAAEDGKLSIFAPDQPDYLVPPKRIDSTSFCDGAIDGVFATTTPGTYRATGWLYDTNGRRTPEYVAVTDDGGTTLGSGVTGGESDVARSRDGAHARFSGWTAFFKAPTRGDIHIAAQIANGSYCAVKTAKAMPASASVGTR